MRRFATICIASIAALVSAPARADELPSSERSPGADRPYTIAQLGLGWLTLPAADVCLQSGACTKGDNSIEADFWQLYRANRYFAIGAGASVALVPVTDTPPSAPGIQRTHTRSYFLVEAQARYYAVHTPTFEAWVGATAGGVIVSDRYSIEGTDKTNAAIIGPGASTIRTEGGSVGALIGAHWSFAPNWAAGFGVRYMRWFLPHVPSRTVFLDVATLTDQQSALNFGISVSYRIAL